MKKTTKAKTPAKKRIYNPVTKSHYSVRVRSTTVGKKGTIIGKWSAIKKNKSGK